MYIMCINKCIYHLFESYHIAQQTCGEYFLFGMVSLIVVITSTRVTCVSAARYVVYKH